MAIIKTKRNEYEHEEQKAVIDWFGIQYPKLKLRLYANPNGGHRHAAVASKLKSEGVTAGVFDLFLMMSRHGKHGLYIEMKAQESVYSRKGVVSDSQKAFQLAALEEGYAAVICYGAGDAIQVINNYLKTNEYP